MGERDKYHASIMNLGECVLGSSDIGWGTEVEAESAAEAFELCVAEAISVSEREGLPPHGIKTSEEDIRRLLVVSQCLVDRSGKVFRIMVPPREQPGFLIGEFVTFDYQSYVRMVRNADGNAIFATIEDARKALPPGAKQLPSKPEYQFVELWEVPDSPSSLSFGRTLALQAAPGCKSCRGRSQQSN